MLDPTSTDISDLGSFEEQRREIFLLDPSRRKLALVPRRRCRALCFSIARME